MIVLNHADLILDETYLVSTETRGYVREPEESPFQPIPTSPPQPPEEEDFLPFLPDLVPLDHRDPGQGLDLQPSPSQLPPIAPGQFKPHQGREQLIVEMGHEGLMIRDLVHPALTDPLRNHQNSTFKLIKLISDFNYQLAKIHEQHATDMAHLVEAFRKKTNEVMSSGPRSVNTIAIAWEQWMADVMQDSASHTEISATLGRNVAKPLLEKTFHMKIQSRKVFKQREAFERMINENEDRTTKSHIDYRKSWTNHVEQQDPHSLAKYLESHNGYVGQIHNVNGMIDYYYEECLPHLLQEFDDVYHDVADVVLDSMSEGSKKITEKTENMTARWQKTSEAVKTISAEKDIASFISAITIPDYVPVTRHNFAPPPPKEVTKKNDIQSQSFGNIQEAGLPVKSCEIVVDRTVAGPARIRHDQLKQEESLMDDQIRVNAEAVESLNRILSKNLDQQLFNKANEIQEEISRKRYDLRCYQIKLSGIRAQKRLFDKTVKQEDDSLIAVQSGGASAKVTGRIKSKWVNAFKNVKGSQPSNNQVQTPGGGKAPKAVEPPPVLETNHQFAEYTFKNITSCDVCSQIMKGNSRQGLKCKLCRMNIHAECQDKVIKCQPKAKFSRTKSGSEMGDDERLSPRASIGPDQRRNTFMNSKPASTESAVLQLLTPPNELAAGHVPGETAASPIRRKMGGSYSRYTGSSPLQRGLTIDTTDLVDTSGRKINTSSVTGNGSNGSAGI